MRLNRLVPHLYVLALALMMAHRLVLHTSAPYIS